MSLGDTLALPKAVRKQLVDVAKASKRPGSAPYKPAASSEPVEPLSDDKRQSILERLRAKRESSLKKPPSGD